MLINVRSVDVRLLRPQSTPMWLAKRGFHVPTPYVCLCSVKFSHHRHIYAISTILFKINRGSSNPWPSAATSITFGNVGKQWELRTLASIYLLRLHLEQPSFLVENRVRAVGVPLYPYFEINYIKPEFLLNTFFCLFPQIWPLTILWNTFYFETQT